MSTLRLLALLISLGMLTVTQAHADAATPGHRQHDGFFLRMSVGESVGGTQLDAAVGSERKVNRYTAGAGANTEVALGYAVIPNLILHASLHLAHVTGYQKLGKADWDEDHSVSTLFGFFGAGATYYFMPINMYVSGSIGPGGISQTQGPKHDLFESNTGFGTSLSLGKEWWVGRSGEWAIGGALNTQYYQAPFENEGRKTQYRGSVSGLAFTATYN